MRTIRLPLANVLPQALPGCTVHVSPDVLLLAPQQGGVAASAFAITSSNALQLTVGVW